MSRFSHLKLGKRPASTTPALCAAKYLTAAALPAVPQIFGHYNQVNAYGMLANDRFGCCVWSGYAHQAMLWNAMAGRRVQFTDDDVLAAYAASTGFNPDDPSTDQGTDMIVAAKYMETHGLVDAAGVVHKIDAHLGLKAGSIAEAAEGAYLFGSVSAGFLLPTSAMEQFDAGKPWTIVRRSKIEGGHYVPVVGRWVKNGVPYFVGITWGEVVLISYEFFQEYNDESVVNLSTEELTNGLTPEHFDLQQLKADLPLLKRAA